MGLLRRTPSGEDQPRKQILRQNMEDFSLSMSSDSFNEEWMDLQDIVNKDLEKDPDFVSLYSIGSSHRGFERQPSYLEIFSDIESKDPFGTFNETTMLYNNYNNNVSTKENNVVVVKQDRTSSLTGYTHYSPSSPSDSWISTDDFPAELDELNEQFEIQLVDKIQLAGEQVDATVAFQESEEEKEEVSDDSDEVYVPEYTKPAKRKRASQILDAEKDDLSSDSDPDFDPEEFEEVVRPSKRRRKQKEKTSDYESEEFSEEEKPQRNPAPRRYRRPSKNPVPQQEEGEHVEDLAVDREVVEGSGDEPLGDHVGGRACRQVPGDQLHCLCSAVGCGEEEPGDELREALSGDALLLPQQGDRDGEGGEADLQVRSQHEGLPRQGQKRPELPAESLNKSFVLLFKIHSVPRRETIFVNKTFSHFSIYSEE